MATLPPGVRDRFFIEVDSGASVCAAAKAVGISSGSGYTWLHQSGRALPSGLPGGRGQGKRKDQQVHDAFWMHLRRGLTVAAARAVGVSKTTGMNWFRKAGGVRPPTVNPELESQVSKGSGPLLWVDRCRIEDLVKAHYIPARIAELLGRDRSTISRELKRGRPAGAREGAYRAVVAQNVVDEGRRRPKQCKLRPGTRLYGEVRSRLRSRHSPEQISGTLRIEFPDDPEMWVSHESIYQALYVQARGGLKAEVKAAVRTGRIRRRPQGRTEKRGRLKDMVMITERPAEAEDRAIPGHWEGDLIMGTGNRSAIGTLVERTSGFVMLLHLGNDHTAESVAAAMTNAVPKIPEELRRSLTWDQGKEMALHTKITEATGLPIYFAEPHSPWQRGTNENTNGLLRQYFPKGTDLSIHGPGILANVAAELNARPRKRHQWRTPSAVLNDLLGSAPSDPVATTA